MRYYAAHKKFSAIVYDYLQTWWNIQILETTFGKRRVSSQYMRQRWMLGLIRCVARIQTPAILMSMNIECILRYHWDNGVQKIFYKHFCIRLRVVVAYGLAARCRIIAVNGKEWPGKNDKNRRRWSWMSYQIRQRSRFVLYFWRTKNRSVWYSQRATTATKKRGKTPTATKRTNTVSNTPLRNARMNSLKPEIFMNSQQVL